MQGEYNPQPKDLSHVELPEDLMALVELMAEYNHDVWGRGKMNKGYVFGPVTSDEEMTHKDLIPYPSLTEESKQYDRNTSLGALRLIHDLGFKIVKA